LRPAQERAEIYAGESTSGDAGCFFCQCEGSKKVRQYLGMTRRCAQRKTTCMDADQRDASKVIIYISNLSKLGLSSIWFSKTGAKFLGRTFIRSRTSVVRGDIFPVSWDAADPDPIRQISHLNPFCVPLCLFGLMVCYTPFAVYLVPFCCNHQPSEVLDCPAPNSIESHSTDR